MNTFKQKALEALRNMENDGDNCFEDTVNHCISMVEAIEEDKVSMECDEELMKELTKEYKNGNEAMMMLKVFNQSKILEELLPLIEEYEDNSVERLLEEIGYSATLVNMKTYWVAQTTNSSQSGATPQEALQKLREALT